MRSVEVDAGLGGDAIIPDEFVVLVELKPVIPGGFQQGEGMIDGKTARQQGRRGGGGRRGGREGGGRLSSKRFREL